MRSKTIAVSGLFVYWTLSVFEPKLASTKAKLSAARKNIIAAAQAIRVLCAVFEWIAKYL